MSGNSREYSEYSTRASMTALLVHADFAFHFSAATRRKLELHGAGFEADISGLLLMRPFRRRGSGFGGRGFANRRTLRLGHRLRHQFRRLQPLGRLPQTFQTVKLACFLGENMDASVP